MEGCEARPDDGNVLRAQGGEGASDGVALRGRFRGKDGELYDGDGGGGVDELHGNEDAVVPAWGALLVLQR